MEQAVLDDARRVLLELCEDGSPVVRADGIDEVLAVAVRRWRSYPRRNPRRPADLSSRTEDLAKGLRDAFESDPGLTGPLMQDYRHLANVLADQFAR